MLDWSAFSVRVESSQVSKLPELLRAIPPAKVEAMQHRLLEVKRQYMLYPFNTAITMIEFRLRTVHESCHENAISIKYYAQKYPHFLCVAKHT